ALRMSRNGNRPSVRHGIPGVDGQVEQRELELVYISVDLVQRQGKTGFYVDRRPHGLFQEIGYAAYHEGNVDGLRIEFLPPCKGQQTLRHGRSPARTLNGSVQQRRGLFVMREPLAQQVQGAEEHHQEVVEIVGDPPRELSQRIHFL